MILAKQESLDSGNTNQGEAAPYFLWGNYLALAEQTILRTPRIIRAFNEIHREDFVEEFQKTASRKDEALPIGHGQKISEPNVVGTMLEHLSPWPGQDILDVGSGSGWTTALLGQLAGKYGRVIGLERIPQLVEFGQANLAKYDLPTAEIRQAEPGKIGLPGSRFKRILVSAGMLEDWIVELQDQLDPKGGILVAPITNANLHTINTVFNQSLLWVERHDDDFRRMWPYRGRQVSFVPLWRDKDEVDK